MNLFKDIAKYFSPPPQMTVSEWADTYRVLPSTSAVPGKWDTSLVPYMREVMDCLSDSSPVREVDFMKAAQVSGPLDITTPILTVDGWKTMEELQPGDVVFDENGNLTNVTGVSEIFENRKCYKMVFSDGSEVVCDSEHLWTFVLWKKGKYKLLYTNKTSKIKYLRAVGNALNFKLITPDNTGRYLKAVEPVDSVPVRCISVDAPSHLFLCGKSKIPTHNTESANCWLGYIIHLAPAPTMVVQPSLDVLKSYSQQKITPLITICPEISERVKEAKSRDSGNTMFFKEFPGGFLKLSGANSAASLRSMAIKNLFLDEVDAYEDDVEGEGDPVDLAMARTRTFSNKKVFRCSTPTISGFSRIEQAYLESDQRKYYVPCPHCGEKHVLEWANFVIPTGENNIKQPQNAFMVCPHCGCKIDEMSKPYMLENGEWRVTAPENEHPKRRGYHISTLYSPLGWFSWGDIAEQWLKAQQDTSRLKTFINTILGETWAEDGEQLDYETLYENNRVCYDAELPSEVLVLTCAVDVQDDRLEYEIEGWAVGNRSYGIEYGILMGDPSKKGVWGLLDDHLKRKFSHADGYNLSISCTCIDSGGHATNAVYKFCKEREHLRVFAIKGRGGSGLPIISRPTRNNRIGAALFSLGVDTGKDLIYARLRERDSTKDGYCYYPMNDDGTPTRGYDIKYFKGLTTEKRRVRYNKGHAKFEWHKASGARNEPFDLKNYNIAALEILGVKLEVLAEKAKQAVVRRKETSTEPVGQPKQRNRRRIVSKGIA